MGNEQSFETSLTREEQEECARRGREAVSQKVRELDEEARRQREKTEADARQRQEHEAEAQRRRKQRDEEEERQRKNDKLLAMQEQALAERQAKAVQDSQRAVADSKRHAAEAAAERKLKAVQAAEEAQANKILNDEKAQREDLAKRARAAKAEIARRTGIVESGPANGNDTSPGSGKAKEKATRQDELRQKFSRPAAPQTLSVRPPPPRPAASRNDSAIEASQDVLALWNPRKERHNDRKAEDRTSASIQAPTASNKRPAPSSVFDDERRASTQRIPKRPKAVPSSSASPQSPNPPAEGRQPPQWYRDLRVEATRGRNVDSGADTLLTALKEHITKAKKEWKAQNTAASQSIFHEVRWRLHRLPFLVVDEQVLRNKGMLGNSNGLPQVFDDSFSDQVEWPHDIRSDAEELYNKWCARDFDIDILRGIGGRKPGQQGGDKVKESYKKPARFFGNGKLQNGQWWPTLLCALRDGAHGESQAGICGNKGVGAYSCFLSHDKDKPYPDIDDGDIVQYCGTDDTTRSGQITAPTQMLLDNLVNGKPVRFIRSHKASHKSKWAPSRGFRYDGLYDVTDYEVLDEVLQRHRFKLVRCGNQGPIRGGDGPESRPTKEEADAYDKDKRLRGL